MQCWLLGSEMSPGTQQRPLRRILNGGVSVSGSPALLVGESGCPGLGTCSARPQMSPRPREAGDRHVVHGSLHGAERWPGLERTGRGVRPRGLEPRASAQPHAVLSRPETEGSPVQTPWAPQPALPGPRPQSSQATPQPCQATLPALPRPRPQAERCAHNPVRCRDGDRRSRREGEWGPGPASFQRRGAVTCKRKGGHM